MNCTGVKYCLGEAKLEKSLQKYTGYYVQGIVLTFTNLPVFLAIMRQRTLRQKKEYLLPAGMLFVNGMMGVAGIVGGGLRSYYIVSGTANVFKSRWQCFWTPFQQMWTWVDMLNPLSLALVSLDRLFAILIPIQYFGFTYRYAYCMWALGLGFTGGWYLVAGYMVREFDQQIYPRICSQDYSQHPSAFQFLQSCRFLFVTCSIVLYPFVLLFYRKQSNKISPGNAKTNKEKNAEQRRFRKMTVSLGISSGITFVFFFIPQLIDLYMSSMFSFELLSEIGPILSLMYRMDPLSDTFIFIFRHREIRMACVYMFQCKELTQAKLEQTETRAARSKAKSQG